MGSGHVEVDLQVQGVGPGQPRALVIPFEVLLANPELDPDDIPGRGFAAEIDQDAEERWVVQSLTLARRVLREES